VAGHYLIGRVRSSEWAWTFAVFSPVLLLAALVLFRFSVLDLATLSWSLVVAASVGVAGLVVALLACAIVWQTGQLGGGRAAAALAMSLVAVLPFALIAALYLRYPEGNAAATTGLVDAVAGAIPNEDATPLVGRDFQATAPIVYGAVRTALAESGMAIRDVETTSQPRPSDDDLGTSGSILAPVPTPRDSVDLATPFDRFAALDAADYTIQAQAEIPLLRLPSDVTVRIQEDNGRTYVDISSRSRTVPLDLGENRRMIERFMVRLDAAMDVLEGVTPEE